MIKSIKYFLVIFVSIFGFSLSVLAESSNFEPFITMDTDITENQVKLALGFAGEELMTVKSTLAYDSNKLSLVEVQALDNFNVTTSLEESDGKYRTIEILADSDYSFNESNYVVLVFEVKNNFKKNNKSDVFLYDYTASGPEKIKFRSKGVIATLNRVSISEMNFVLDNIDNGTKTKYWLLSHIYLFVIIILVIVGVVVLILLLPSKRKKEMREKTSEESIKADNYDPSQSNIKIDREAIDAIGKVEKPIDMTQAIIVNEDVKPFGDIVGKFDSVEDKNTPEQVNAVEAPINVFENRTPDLMNASNNQAPVNQTELPKVTGEVKDVGTSVNGFDPFNATIDNQDNSDKTVETLEEMPVLKENVNNQQSAPNSELTVINPQNFESVELPKLNEDINLGVSSNNDENKTSNNGSNILSILFVLFMLSSFLVTNVFAEEGNFQISALRDCVVGRTAYDKSLDYNNDGVVDILDIIETKDLTNCSFENLLSTDPGFAEIHGKSNNLISSDSNYVPPTKRAGKKTTRTTKERTTRNTTTRKQSGGSSSGGSSSGGSSGGSSSGATNRTTTARNTTTRNTTTRRTTTGKTQAPTYNVKINTTNGSANPSSFDLQVGKSKTVTLTPIEGYTLDEASSKCSGVAYSFSSSTRLMLANISGNATCNLKFVPSSDIRVTLNYYIGKGNSNYVTPDISYSSKSVSNGGNGVYNQKWSTGVALPTGYRLREAPSCGSYSNGVFSITIPANSITCKMYFDPLLYNFRVYVSGQSSQINTGTLTRIFYGEKKKIEFPSNSLYKNVSCSGGTASKLSRSGSSPYMYSFYYTHGSTGDATCNIS